MVTDVELQDDHPRNIMAVAQAFHLGSNDTKVLGNDRQRSERIFHGIEDRIAGAGFPRAAAGSVRISRNRPVRFQAAKVIDAYEIGELR